MPLFPMLLIALPLLELYLLIRVGSALGFLSTLLLTLSMAALGIWLTRQQGLGIPRRMQSLIERGEAPTLELIEGLLLLLAGLCLLLPGFLTDALGLLLLIPPLRRWLARRQVQPRWNTGTARPRGPECAGTPPPTIIEGEFRREG